MSFDFVAPRGNSDSVAVYITVKQTPRFSYTEPTRGTVWLDDFTIKEQ